MAGFSLGWLTQSVSLPLWAVLALAGFQRVIRLARGAVRRGRRSEREGTES
jgi:hypothetical protein